MPPSIFGTLFIDVQNVSRAIAVEVEASLDGNAGFTTGSIRWVEVETSTASGTLSLAVPVNGC